MSDCAKASPELIEMLGDVVAPSLKDILRAGEVESVLITWNTGRLGHEMTPQLELTVVARGERFEAVLWRAGQQPAAVQAERERLSSSLQDFVAESQFAWGELRLPLEPTQPDQGNA